MKARSPLALTLSAAAIAVAAGIAAVAATPAAADDRPRADEVRKLREAGKILSMEDILNRSRAAQPGQVVEIELDDDDGRYTYEVKLIDDANRVHKLKLDASTGEVLRRKAK
ncbi:PepSY domain-containing protein [Thauera sinica]|uniref:PepSY domain-containing protein n=1 Tax=Thauera sinica TaxID=2665146 RepID=A0ABW1AW59_9RHOO|nr:PepSY domain-containing protein [Thauera sp. K11]ATE59897.1 peptidase M4 [Thauera sp. K11]